MAHPTLNIAINAAHIAGDILRQELHKVATIPITRTARHDYVTEIDKASEAQIVREIKRYHPDHAFLCEEGGEQGEGDFVWIIDPLDGTSNYLHGMPHFGISIAMQEKGRTQHAVVYDPMRDEMFSASRGGGAHLNNTRIRVSARTTLDSAIVATSFPFRQRGMMGTYTGIFSDVYKKIEDIRRYGAASLDLAWVAAGRMDAYFEIGLKPLDVAAGALLVREAGGVVSDF
jgi:myo-inositol-1(or 4)-monophosphatase